MRREKNDYYLDLAEAVLARGTCLRRNFGAIIVKNDQIISTGYTGAPRGQKNCTEVGHCRREFLKIPKGERYELCRSVHAEANAIIHAARRDMLGAVLYLVGKNAATGELVEGAAPCSMCRRLIINAGIAQVVIRQAGQKIVEIDVQDAWVKSEGDTCEGY